MNNFISIQDVADLPALIHSAMQIKSRPQSKNPIHKNKVLGLIFFNASLRTRLSTYRAAINLGMEVITFNMIGESWELEIEDGVKMNGTKPEHIKDAIPVISGYCDLLGVRSFPTLKNKERDYEEVIINAFLKYSRCPVINLESATLHPLQSLTDMLTIEEHKTVPTPKVVLSWAPHIKPLPQAVANSFAQWVQRSDYEFVITCPKGFELSETYTQGVPVLYDQKKALEGADFVYVKNWSSYHNYGKVLQNNEWMMTLEKLKSTRNAKLMHCMPVRRNVVISDDALDSDQSLIYAQAMNRQHAAQAVLESILGQSSTEKEQ